MNNKIEERNSFKNLNSASWAMIFRRKCRLVAWSLARKVKLSLVQLLKEILRREAEKCNKQQMKRTFKPRVATGKSSNPPKTQEQNQGREPLSQMHPITNYKQTKQFKIKMRMKLLLKMLPNLMKRGSKSLLSLALHRSVREPIVCIVVGQSPGGAAASKRVVHRCVVMSVRWKECQVLIKQMMTWRKSGLNYVRLA